MTNESISKKLIDACNKCSKYFYSDGNKEYIEQYEKAEVEFKQLAQEVEDTYKDNYDHIVELAESIDEVHQREKLWARLDKWYQLQLEPRGYQVMRQSNIEELRKQLGIKGAE